MKWKCSINVAKYRNQYMPRATIDTSAKSKTFARYLSLRTNMPMQWVRSAPDVQCTASRSLPRSEYYDVVKMISITMNNIVLKRHGNPERGQLRHRPGNQARVWSEPDTMLKHGSCEIKKEPDTERFIIK